MMGSEREPGLYILAARSIFAQLAMPQHASMELRVSCYEIYGGKVLIRRSPPAATPRAAWAAGIAFGALEDLPALACGGARGV